MIQNPPPGTTGGSGSGAPPPPPPPPPGGGGGGGGGGGHKGGHKNHGTGRSNRTRGYRINLALTNLTNALIEKGFTGQQAQQFATFALKQKGVRIGRGGHIHYKHGLYTGADFANSPLLNYVTGAKAKAANEAALKADPNYQMALQQLGLARDQSQAALDAQRTQALVDFGDPSFVQGDNALAAAAGANPFGTAQTLLRNYQDQTRQVRQQANDIGTNFGGGQVSGLAGAQHTFAGNESQATESLQNLLNSITMQGQQLGQNYNLGQQNALLQTQQNLQQQGLLAAHGPKIKFGDGMKFRLWNARPPRAPRRNRTRDQIVAAGGGPAGSTGSPGSISYPTPDPTGGRLY